MEFNFNGKRALVTGAGRGVGREITKRLVKGGAKVIAVSRTEEHLKTLKAECPSIEIIAVDIGDWKSTQVALGNIGHVDLLVNNAAILDMVPFGEITEDFFDRHFSINLKGPINVAQIVIKSMKEKGTGGVIINVSSMASKISMAGNAVYSAAKAGLDQLTRVMAVELGPHKIRVNTINPGGINTDMARSVVERYFKDVPMEALIANVPLGRLSETSDIVDTILYLLSDNAMMIHGANIVVDGGAGLVRM